MQRKISDAQRERAWQIYQANKTISQVARSLEVSYASAWCLTEGKRQGFKSLSEYQEHLVKERGFKNRGEYLEDLAKRQGFKNSGEYREHLVKERQQQHPNKELSRLIKSRLNELERNQSWLAEQIGVTRQAVSLYIQGKNIPQGKTLSLLFSALKVERKPKSLDDLVE